MTRRQSSEVRRTGVKAAVLLLSACALYALFPSDERLRVLVWIMLLREREFSIPETRKRLGQIAAWLWRGIR